ncbi:P-loop containing nucleoside triphosphate hydrolase protein [Dunaliella salina]|uniref:P-loop containing nucleoside triphosphate hydrolase protein n=1 Tax=Dunaliella salina TaxID=3046 RepID=A0ABQ7GYM9_DUNSA|nr:P-loop containing nucleoside triphosphate hydrolase protein [Dunaliella salina]|eukprot:KAF5839706.1 P-loop containing nucleoside triphosphate hydrolase protein [Dunaliella salina]
MSSTDKEKKKSDKKEKEGKEGKEKKEKKPKDEEGKEKKEKKHKDKEDGGKEKKEKSSKKETAGQKAAPTAPPPRQPRGPPPRGPPKPSDDYMAGLDLPPSSESDEEVERSARMDADCVCVCATDREAKKLADKDRKDMEKAYQLKLAALREDDNVFDVSYEGQGEDSATASATDVKCHNLTVRAKGKLLLENCTFTISAGRRYGLVGPNGRGKSTLLRLLAKRQLPVPENLDVLLVEQEVEGGTQSALEAVVAADVELMELRAEEAELNRKLEHPDQQDEEFDQETAQDRLNEVYERQNQISASSAESRASKILHGLGFNTDMQRRPTQSFSGGWRMRISLARALYIQPTLLLLDEPTNHLDLRAVLWLEEYLQRWKKTLVVVSHDRDFLNTVTTDIIHLHDNKLHQYKGNFAQFDEMYEQRRREANKAYEKFEKQMKAAKSGGGKDSKAKQEQVRSNAAKNTSKKNKNQPIDDAGASTANVNQPQKWSDYSVRGDDFGLKNVNFGIDMGSRVAIVGPNGAGKTTFMNLLSGDLEPVGGESRRSHKLRIGRYAQHFVDALSYDENPVEYLMNRFPESRMKPEQMRAMLGRFGLSGQHHLTPICKLSGGQKSRVVFTAIALLQPHILLLDEPTNHLDMQSIDALCDALDEFQGGVVVISHDAQLLSRLCADEERSQVLIVEDGTIKNFPGDFEDYRNQLVKEIAEELDEE